MTQSSRGTYHTSDGLERAIVDLVRVGTRGHGSGVRQLASRLMRTVPPGVRDEEGFRDAVHAAISAGASSTELRFASDALPTENDSAQPLVDVDLSPDGMGLVLNEEVMSELAEILLERTRADELRRVGMSPTRTLLLSGSPGVGKTMTARWLAQSLDLPLVSLDISSVVSSYLGSSGRNLKAVLDYAKSGSCVLLLDEFDAIGKRRDDDSDLGELKRLVNVVLVELDRWPDRSLLVAATNHPQLLDPAIERRFDRSLTLAPPEVRQRRAILGHLVAESGDVDPAYLDLFAEATPGLSSSDLTRVWLLCRRRAVLQGAPLADVLLAEIARNRCAPGAHRDRLFAALSGRLGMSNRQIASATGVSHPTVAAGIQRARGGLDGGVTE